MCYEDFSGEHQIIFKRSGEGIVSVGVREQNVKWILEVDSVGSKKFEIIFQGIPIKDNNIMFKGIDDNNEFEIDSTELYIKRRNSELMSLQHHYYCICSEFFLKKISDEVELELSKAEAYVLNFDFLGLEYNTVGDRIVANEFSINSEEWIFECVLLDEYEQLKNQINDEILKEVIFSKIILKPLVPTSYRGFDQELNSIVLFLSSITLNGVYPQVVKYFNNEEIVGIKIIDTVKKPYNTNVLINNLHTYQGLKLCAEKSYNTFKELENPLELMGFVNRIVDIQSQSYIDNKVISLIVAYEFLLSKYLLYLGEDEETIIDLNIQQKLGKLNKHLRFIPKEYLGDRLRTVRNPLFHLGVIPFMDTKELNDFYNEYNELLMKIYLKIIEYDGQYISRINFRVNNLN